MVSDFDRADVEMLVPKLAVQQRDGSWVFSWPAGLGNERLHAHTLGGLKEQLLARLGGTAAPACEPPA